MKTIFIKTIILLNVCFYQVCFAAQQMSQIGKQIALQHKQWRMQGVQLSLYQSAMKAGETIEASPLSQVAGAIVIFWFLGKKGLRDKAERFFRDEVMEPLGTKNILWGYDLSAWGVLVGEDLGQYTQRDYEMFGKFIENREKRFQCFQCVSSYEFFVWLGNMMRRCPDFIRNILNRDFIYEKSKKRGDDDCTVKEKELTVARLQAVVPDVRWDLCFQGTRFERLPHRTSLFGFAIS